MAARTGVAGVAVQVAREAAADTVAMVAGGGIRGHRGQARNEHGSADEGYELELHVFFLQNWKMEGVGFASALPTGVWRPRTGGSLLRPDISDLELSVVARYIAHTP